MENNNPIQVENGSSQKVITVVSIFVAMALIFFCGTSLYDFFTKNNNDDTINLSDYSAEYDGNYISVEDYKIEKVSKEVIKLNNKIPILLNEWKITNNGKSAGYPAALLIVKQSKDGEEIELEDAENLLLKYDNEHDDIYWTEKFYSRYSNINPGESNTFYTAHIIYDENQDMIAEWQDMANY